MNLIENIVHHETFSLQKKVSNWKDAVKIGCDLLENKNFAKSSYYHGIIESTEKLGAYYVLAPGFAMPHARPEAGALKTGFALVTLQEPVTFNSDNDPVDLCIVFCAKNKEEMNEDAIIQIMDLLEDEDAMLKIRTATSIDDIKKLL